MEESRRILQLDEGTMLKAQYRVSGILDTSIRSRIYLARDCKREQDVILKQLYSEEISPADHRWNTEREWFLEEAESLRKLPGGTAIPRLIDRFSEGDTEYLVLEHIPGTTLLQWVQENGAMSVPVAMQLLMMVLITLEPLHKAGLFHGGINPGNILLTEDGSVTILEWGVVQYIGNTDYNRPVLNEHYAACEQFMLRGKAGTYTDVYSICASFLFAATGKHPVSCPERLLSFEDDYDFGELKLTPKLRNGLIEGLRLQARRRVQTAGKLLNLLSIRNKW